MDINTKKILKLKISNNNSKMGSLVNSTSFNVNCTCTNKLPCYSACYAHHMQNYYTSCGTSWHNNYLLYKQDIKLYKLQLLIALKSSIYFRFFVGGDLPDTNYLPMVFELAKQAPQCKILLFSKKYGFVAHAIKNIGGKNNIPKNVNIILSGWDGIKIYNPYNLPIAIVYDKKTPAPKNSFICLADGKKEKTANNSMTCSECALSGMGCFNCNNDSNYKVAFKKH